MKFNTQTLFTLSKNYWNSCSSVLFYSVLLVFVCISICSVGFFLPFRFILLAQGSLSSCTFQKMPIKTTHTHKKNKHRSQILRFFVPLFLFIRLLLFHSQETRFFFRLVSFLYFQVTMKNWFLWAKRFLWFVLDFPIIFRYFSSSNQIYYC